MFAANFAPGICFRGKTCGLSLSLTGGCFKDYLRTGRLELIIGFGLAFLTRSVRIMQLLAVRSCKVAFVVGSSNWGVLSISLREAADIMEKPCASSRNIALDTF